MGTFDDAGKGSVQRSLDDGAASMAADAREQQLLRQLRALEDEVAGLRRDAHENAELRRLVAQLREANENLVLATVNAQGLRDDAEAANRRQNEFLAMLAHELRNPLAPISMAATLLERVPNASSQLLGLTGVISRQVGHMAHLLDDLLDAARISSGKITLLVQPLLLSEVMDQAIETVHPRIKERQQQLFVDLPSEPVVIEGDRVRLTQVFTNLLGNASKYTGDKGEICLSVRVDGSDVVVTIQDNGIGIAAQVIPHIFDLFTQGPRSLARSEGGLGIGLNVVRNLVSMHDGKIDASSGGVGQGSRFVVRLRASDKQVSAPPSMPCPQNKDRCCNVLLVEDNVDACETLRHFLSIEGHDVAVAYDGRAGLEAALERRFDVVICDIGLPGIDGYDLMRTLRAHPEGRWPLAVALSGYGQDGDRARAIGAGFDHYFVKPASSEALLALLASCGKRRPQA